MRWGSSSRFLNGRHVILYMLCKRDIRVHKLSNSNNTYPHVQYCRRTRDQGEYRKKYTYNYRLNMIISRSCFTDAVSDLPHKKHCHILYSNMTSVEIINLSSLVVHTERPRLWAWWRTCHTRRASVRPGRISSASWIITKMAVLALN